MTILPKSVSNISARPAAYDVEAIRADFPILRQKVHGKPLVYLDNGASAQKPRAVLDTIQRAYAEEYANVHRGLHYLSNLSTANFEKARETVRGFINARSDAEIIFTRNATEAINLVASSYGAPHIGEGDEIVLSIMQDYADVVVKPPILFAGAVLLGCLLSWIVPLGPGLGSANTRALAAGGALALVGLALGALSVREFRRAGTSVIPGEPSTVLLESGPYRYTRNPIYIAFVILYFGLAIMVSAGADNGQRFLVDAGQSGAAASQEVFLWMLGGIAVVTTLSLWHFVVFGIPSLLGGWYTSNKQWLGTLLILVLMGGAFYLMKGKVSETGEPWQGPSVADPASYGGYAASDQKVE